MSIKILGVITEDKVEKVKVNKHIDELSNRLYDSSIPHLIIEDDKDGVCIMPTQCAPSVLVYDDENKQWKYLERYMEEGSENSTLSTVYIVEASNKKTDILELVKMMIKEYNANGY
jgi:hypothetical protein